jgi:hypothetical protein
VGLDGAIASGGDHHHADDDRILGGHFTENL